MKKLLLITVICLNSNAIGPVKELPPHSGYPLWKEKFMRSVTAGVSIGAFTGIVSAVIDKQTPLLTLPFSMLAGIVMRNMITESILENFDEDRVPHNKWIVRSVSCVSSWAVWYVILKTVGFPDYNKVKEYWVG